MKPMGLSLGKQKYEHDERTLMLGKFILPDLYYPTRWDFDASRRKFPLSMWGNDEWGDCVIAGRANQQLRLERIEQRRTLPLTATDVISEYKAMTGSQEPGDRYDTGLEVIAAMRDWRNQGWKIGLHDYKIAAYGELDPENHNALRSACYHLCGIHFGFWLPIAAQEMTSNGVWEYNNENGNDWKPGSWGGHLVYCKRYDNDNFYVLTWGMEVRVTIPFLDRYCDEAWAVVDDADSWRTKNSIDVTALMDSLRAISSKINQ